MKEADTGLDVAKMQLVNMWNYLECHEPLAMSQTAGGVQDRIGAFADCTHNAGNRAAVTARTLRPFQDPFVVGRNGRYRKLRFHEHDLVAAGLEVVEQIHCGSFG